MVNGIIGKKVGMTQLYREDGTAVPVTVIKAGPCVVVQRKTTARDGYEAAQIGMVEKVSPRRVNKPRAGHFKRADVPPVRQLREVRLEDGAEVTPGDSVLVTQFEALDYVDVVGTSKGRGFAGVIKRHGFGGGRKSHGSMFHRAPGSIGQSAWPSRVFKNMRMPGQMGNARVTVRGLQVERVDEERNLLIVRGAVPGARNGYLLIRKSIKSAAKSE